MKQQGWYNDLGEFVSLSSIIDKWEEMGGLLEDAAAQFGVAREFRDHQESLQKNGAKTKKRRKLKRRK